MGSQGRSDAGAFDCMSSNHHSVQLPALPFQTQLWLMQHIAPGVGVANISASLHWQGALDLQALQFAATEFVIRHPFLQRAVAMNDTGKLTQIRCSPRAVDIKVADVQLVAPEARDQEVSRLLAQACETPIKRDQFPPIRCVVIRSGPELYDIAFVFNHLTCDGLSMGVLCKELMRSYETWLEGSPPQWKSDFPDTLVDELLQSVLAIETAPANSLTYLPYDLTPPIKTNYKGQRYSFSFSDHQSAQISELSSQHAVSPFVTLLTLTQLVTQRYVGENQLRLDFLTSGRESHQRRMVGPFCETVGLQTDIGPHESVVELLTKNQKQIERVNQQGPRKTPLSNHRSGILLDYQLALQPVTLNNGVVVTPSEWDNGAAVAEFCLGIRKDRKRFGGHIQYDVKLFSPSYIEQFAGHLKQALHCVASNPHCKVCDVTVLRGQDREIINSINQQSEHDRKPECIDELFFKQAAVTPDAVALITDDGQVSYSSLAKQVKKYAQGLREAHVQRGDRVGLHANVGTNGVACMLAVMHVGAAYVPIAVEIPTARKQLIANQAQLSCIVDADRSLANFQSNVPIIELRQFNSIFDTKVDQHSPNDSAYVLFTSGTTGIPKGVEVTHANVANFFLGMDQLQDARTPGCWLAATNIGFDISVFELLWTLTRGYSVVISKTSLQQSFSKLVLLHGVTHLQCTPSMMQLLLADRKNHESIGTLQSIYVGGDVMSEQLASNLNRLARGQVYNMYGPTETTVWSTCWKVGREKARIGKPLKNQSAYVLNSQMQATPPGLIGELYIGGAGVTKGYFGDDDLTETKFIQHPEHGRLFRTGDLVRLTDSSELEFHGRNDTQIKLHGHRFELGEIEATLRSHPDVLEAVTILDPSSPMPQLRAFVHHRIPSVAATALADFLSRQLPDYMIPRHFEFVDQLPLNSSGKIDRNALAAQSPKTDESNQRLGSPPHSPSIWHQQEFNQLAEVVMQELRIEHLPLNGRWTDLDINSLDILGLVVKVEKELGVSLPVADLFRHDSIGATLHAAIAREIPTRDDPAPAIVNAIEEGVI